MSSEACVRIAARNNAEWCDIVCRTHGVSGAFHKDAWISARRTPPLYPDAISLEPDVSAERLVDGVDTVTPGCSIKDSFGDLTLASAGFRVLFDAEWIHLPAGARRGTGRSSLRWSRIGDAAALEAWEIAWSDGGASRGLFRPELLTNDALVVLGAFDGTRIVAGAIANRSDAVVGISNLFGISHDLEPLWQGCLDAVELHFPKVAMVGYESAAMLEAARACGFEPVGRLRIWIAGSSELVVP